MMVHCEVPSSKRKLGKKGKELQAEWDALQSRWASLPKFGKPGQLKREPTKPLPDLETPTTAMGKAFEAAYAPKKEPMKYTGAKMIGTATMHKSNEVPVFSTEEVLDISRMRR